MTKSQKEKIVNLLENPWHAHTIKILKQIHGDPLPDLIEKGFIQIVENGNMPQKQIANWVGNYLHVGEKIVSESATGSDFSVFWIRLHEILSFLPNYFSNCTALKIYLGLGELLLKIKDTYLPEELIQIEYQRNCNAHIHQNAYKIKANYNKEIITEDGLHFKGNSKGPNKVEINTVINEELKKYFINEEFMARAYFTKTQQEMEKLWHDLKAEFQV